MTISVLVTPSPETVVVWVTKFVMVSVFGEALAVMTSVVVSVTPGPLTIKVVISVVASPVRVKV